MLTKKDKDRPALEETFSSLQDAGVRLLFKANIHQKFAVIDQKIVWYGSINLLSYGSAQESLMRLESPNIAQELLKVVLGQRPDCLGGTEPGFFFSLAPLLKVW